MSSPKPHQKGHWHWPEGACLVLLGDPGAGKGTQSRRLSRQYHVVDLDMGRHLFEQRQLHPELDELLKHTADVGKLTPSHIIRDEFVKVISSTPKHKGIVFDGTPKMPTEARFIMQQLRQAGRKKIIVVYLKIPYYLIKERVLHRRGYSGQLYSRKDDTTEALRARMDYYRTSMRGVLDYFASQVPMATIHATGTRDEVYRRLIGLCRKMFDMYE